MCSLASAFSQVPYYLRKSVTSVTVVYSETDYSHMVNHQITVGTKNPVAADVLVHESAHAQVTGNSCSMLVIWGITSVLDFGCTHVIITTQI